MSEKISELENLLRVGKLAAEPGAPDEIAGLLTSGCERLVDARNESLALSSRFDLAYNAAHAFSLAALRWHGYRSDSRYLVFQTLPHTIGLPPRYGACLPRRTNCVTRRNTAGVSMWMHCC